MERFRTRCGFAGLALLSAALVGCGGAKPSAADVATPAKFANHAAPTATAPTPIAAATPISAPTKAASPSGVQPTRKVTLNPFQMPDFPDEFLPHQEEPTPAETAAPVRPIERPKVRLLGFSNVDGFKALVELKGDVLAVEEGDVIEGVQVMSIQPPKVMFRFANSNWSTELFDQPWSNQQTGLASTPRSSRTTSAQSRSTPRTNAPAFATRTSEAAALRGPAGHDMLGAGIPGTGGSSAKPAIPGMPSDGSNGIPRRGSIPGMPSGGAPGASGMPGMPGGEGELPGGVGAIPSGMPGGIN